MKYEARLSLLTDKVFGQKVRYALISAAGDIINTQNSTPEALSWAWGVMQGKLDAGQVTFGATLCAAVDTIADAGPTVDDQAIQAVIDKARDKFVELASTKRDA